MDRCFRFTIIDFDELYIIPHPGFELNVIFAGPRFLFGIRTYSSSILEDLSWEMKLFDFFRCAMFPDNQALKLS